MCIGDRDWTKKEHIPRNPGTFIRPFNLDQLQPHISHTPQASSPSWSVKGTNLLDLFLCNSLVMVARGLGLLALGRVHDE